MSKLPIDDQLYSTTTGIYSTNSLFTRFASEADLRIEEKDAYPGAAPTHTHEFIHYLHNISTKSGIKLIFLTHTAIFMAAHFLIKKEQEINISSQNSDQHEHISFFINHLEYIYGEFNETSWNNSATTKCWKFSNLKTYKPKVDIKFFSYQVDIAENFSKNRNGVLRIGLTFITEGVAYEVEREIWKEQGVQPSLIDSKTPPFPYLAYEHLINYIVRRTTTPLERIKIGNAALMHDSPSQGFVDACLALKKGSNFLNNYYENSITNFKSYIDGDFERYFDSIKAFYAQTDKLLKPFEHYASIIRSTAQKRINFPDLETIFIGKNLTPSNFLQLSSTIAEHCIIQEKTKTQSKIDIIGNPDSLASSSDEDAAWFYVLCSAIHFVQQHLTSNGLIVETSNLREKKCPFSGACAVEISENNPDTCKKSPWKFKPQNQEDACWYSAGVKSITPKIDKV